jgi:hypothetical protein
MRKALKTRRSGEGSKREVMTNIPADCGSPDHSAIRSGVSGDPTKNHAAR